jgi:biotin carboxyl carrier protein
MLIRSEIAASVWQIRVAVGDVVAVGEELLILESMKMEIPVGAPVGGRVGRIHVKPDDVVSSGDLLVEIE